MARINRNYEKLPGSYLFSEIARRTAAYQEANPDARLIKMGIGDVTLPLAASVTEAMHKAVEEQGHKGTFHGYIPASRAMSSCATLSAGITRATVSSWICPKFSSPTVPRATWQPAGPVQSGQHDPCSRPGLPVYVDDNVMAGRKILYLPATAENGFLPMPDEAPHADIVYICSPNNPTGATYSVEQLKAWVAWGEGQ